MRWCGPFSFFLPPSPKLYSPILAPNGFFLVVCFSCVFSLLSNLFYEALKWTKNSNPTPLDTQFPKPQLLAMRSNISILCPPLRLCDQTPDPDLVQTSTPSSALDLTFLDFVPWLVDWGVWFLGFWTSVLGTGLGFLYLGRMLDS